MGRSLLPWRTQGCRAKPASGGSPSSEVRIISSDNSYDNSKTNVSAGERGSERQVADEDADEDEDGNDNLGDRYETDSEDERRRREEELDTNTSYVASTVRERDQPVSDWEDFEHHDRFIRWDTNDEDEEEVAAEGEENE